MAKMKTAKQLKIRNWEYSALQRVYKLLVKTVKTQYDPRHKDRLRVMGPLFNMKYQIQFMGGVHNWLNDYLNQNQNQKGVRACIGGWMVLFEEMELGKLIILNDRYVCIPDDVMIRARSYVRYCVTSEYLPDFENTNDKLKNTHSEAIRKLLYPKNEDLNWERITTWQAVIAIENFLCTGNPDWNYVVENH